MKLQVNMGYGCYLKGWKNATRGPGKVLCKHKSMSPGAIVLGIRAMRCHVGVNCVNKRLSMTFQIRYVLQQLPLCLTWDLCE